jgi:hypothetical protein
MALNRNYQRLSFDPSSQYSTLLPPMQESTPADRSKRKYSLKLFSKHRRHSSMPEYPPDMETRNTLAHARSFLSHARSQFKQLMRRNTTTKPGKNQSPPQIASSAIGHSRGTNAYDLVPYGSGPHRGMTNTSADPSMPEPVGMSPLQFVQYSHN